MSPTLDHLLGSSRSGEWACVNGTVDLAGDWHDSLWHDWLSDMMSIGMVGPAGAGKGRGNGGRPNMSAKAWHRSSTLGFCMQGRFLPYPGVIACCWNCAMSARVRGDEDWWAMARAPGDGNMGWSGVEAEAVDGVGSGTSMGSTCIGDSGQCCGPGAGGGGAATSGATGVTWGMGTAGAAGAAGGG
jgi:hypothetical protein